jgi:peroxiredoxin
MMSNELQVGSQAPDFKLPSSKSGETGIAYYRGKSMLVLFFVREYN